MNDEQMFHEKLSNAINSHDAVIYMKGSKSFPLCGFSACSISILKKYNIDLFCENILKDYDFMNWLIDINEWPIFPQIYINATFIGGYDILKSMDSSGELFELLKKRKLNTCAA